MSFSNWKTGGRSLPVKKKKKPLEQWQEGEQIFSPQEWAENFPPQFQTFWPEWLDTTELPEWVKGLRPWQEKAVEEILGHFHNGFKVVYLNAPTGAGKTLIAETVRQVLMYELDDSEKTNCQACYVCTTKPLQDQFLEDFEYAKVIKGKNNYPTANYPELFNPSGTDDRGNYNWKLAQEHLSCSECTYDKVNGCDWCSCDNDIEPREAINRCPYRVARTEALTAELAVLNTAYFIGATQAGLFQERDLVILDEADLLEGVLMGQVDVTISKSLVKKLKLEQPKKKTVADCWPAWIEEEALPKIEAHIQELRLKPMKKQARIKKVRRMLDLMERLKSVRSSMIEGEVSWVYDGYKTGAVIFKPVKVDQFGEAFIWSKAKRFLVMSGTFLDVRKFAASIGCPQEEIKVVNVESSFPPQQRPVILQNTCPNTFKERGTAWPKIANEIDRICSLHPDVNILVHTVSYNFTDYVKNRLMKRRPIIRRPVITYENAAGREKALKRFQECSNAVVLAPSFDRGIDLKGDLCRVQIVCKMPYPPLTDKQISARLYGSRDGQDWYSMQAIRTLVQMVGRGMRKPDDWCLTYVLDSQAAKLIREKRHLFPKYFLDSIQRKGFTGISKMGAKSRWKK